jgi:uncharacterized phage protein gp47/JayE
MAFARPTLQDLIARADADLAARLTAAELPYSDRKVIARALAGAAHGLYGYLDWLARQIIADTAEAEHLERWAGIFGLTRKAAAQAKGNVTFTGTDGVVIPAGTALQRSDGQEYTTDAQGTIAAGAATAAVTAKTGGKASNAASGDKLTLVSPVTGINSEATVATGGLAGGLDAETDTALLARLLLRLKLGVPNGKDGDYVQWALEVAGVTRAWDTALYTGLGTVGVQFVVDNDAMDATIIPTAGKVTEVQAYIDARRPLPSAVTVTAPIAKALNLTIQLTPSTQVVKDAVTAEIKALLRRHAEPGGTVLLSKLREAISLAEGETDHVLVSPAANVAHAAGEIATLGAITWQ